MTPVISALVAMSLRRLLLAQHRLHAREVAPQRLELLRRLELPHRLLDAQPEQLIVHVLLALPQLVDREVADLRHLHDALSSANRVPNPVFNLSLAGPRGTAFRGSA